MATNQLLLLRGWEWKQVLPMVPAHSTTRKWADHLSYSSCPTCRPLLLLPQAKSQLAPPLGVSRAPVACFCAFVLQPPVKSCVNFLSGLLSISWLKSPRTQLGTVSPEDLSPCLVDGLLLPVFSDADPYGLVHPFCSLVWLNFIFLEGYQSNWIRNGLILV